MSEYGKKLLELRNQISKRTILEENLYQLNKQKLQAEGMLEPLEQQLNSAIKKVDKLDKKGIFSLFTSNGKRDLAYMEMSSLKAEYSAAKRSIDSISHDIQKVFNQMSAYSDAERLYNTLMTEVNTALASGNNDIIDDDELKQLQKYEIRAKINQLEKAVTQGEHLITVIDGYVNMSDSTFGKSFTGENLRIAIMKFRTALDSKEKATVVSVETESYKRVPNLWGYDPLTRDRYHDNLPLNMVKGMSAKELRENLAELSHNTQQIINELEKEVKQLKSLL